MALGKTIFKKSFQNAFLTDISILLYKYLYNMGSRKEGFLEIDPLSVYFTHSRVRPQFSGCGRKLQDTLDDLLTGRMELETLPFITILGGGDGHYFSLNNRRLWVLKELRKAGKLPLNVVRVRTKEALPRERDRYTSIKCSLTAVIMGGGTGDIIEDEESIEERPICSPLSCSKSTWHATILKSIKQLQQKFKTGKLKEIQNKIDDFLDAKLIKENEEESLWILIHQQ